MPPPIEAGAGVPAVRLDGMASTDDRRLALGTAAEGVAGIRLIQARRS